MFWWSLVLVHVVGSKCLASADSFLRQARAGRPGSGFREGGPEKETVAWQGFRAVVLDLGQLESVYCPSGRKSLGRFVRLGWI